jgi:putative sugar O-methyltransferase
VTNIKSRLRFLWDLGGRNPFIILIRILDEFKNRANSWDVSVQDWRTSGSLSNTPSYLTACQAAVTSEDSFSKFRSCKSYRKILEHVPPRTGEKYLRQLKKTELPFQTLKNLVPQINLGGPATYHFHDLGSISPTSIRYAKVHNDIRNLFGDLTDFKILEIGCGYGGLALQMMNGESLRSFEIADLEVVEQLAEKYVLRINPESENVLKIARQHKHGEIDLVISNYAFSELTRKIQDEYLENYILKSKRGYMIYNHINPIEYESYSALDICKIVPGAEIIQEIPKTDKTNVLIVWGHNSN